MNELFPIFLKLHELQTLVVGGGPVALEKLQAIVYNSPQAKVRVIAKEYSKETQEFLVAQPHLQWRTKDWEPEDLEEIDLVILATNNPKLNQTVRALSREKHLLINVADKPALCDFYLSSVVRKGNLKLAISTNGKSPTMAKRLKEIFSDLLPEEIDEALDLLQTYRNQLKGDFKHKVETLNAHTLAVLKGNDTRF
ncbi:bifunctional precorrin-2 dehydrogenase/sirohydrochlorin ferrochelatase [Leadbetterella byssophila]|uniref:precorrin-2 dehydrogenase/sirohydrochlorin ferrochelatase family protein n=1 Tax=Leadbetterella byssophila TaxID=316068 RepID=UPI0039A3D990